MDWHNSSSPEKVKAVKQVYAKGGEVVVPGASASPATKTPNPSTLSSTGGQEGNGVPGPRNCHN